MGLQRQPADDDVEIVTGREEEEEDGEWSKCKNAPEKEVTLFALRLAVLEKAASGLGALGFIWATVVLLGGFAITLPSEDFWLITLILLIEGGRIFSRSHELEWQHQATSSSSSSAADVEEQPHLPRTWHILHVPIIHLPLGRWIFFSRNISRGLYWLQLIFASACVVLSLTRLAQHDRRCYHGDKSNRCSALIVFYTLTLVEALLFLTEKAYWRYQLTYRRLLEKVSQRCDLGPFGKVSVERFFYDAYSHCINGSVFDGVKMDLVSFSMELLATSSSSLEEQLMSIRILFRFSTNHRLASDALRRVGASTTVMERLLQVLNWEINFNPVEEEARKSAAHIISKLASKKHHAVRVAGIPGAVESISSLLNTADYEVSEFNLLGLLILKNLAQDHDNCCRIGSIGGLLPKIINFTRRLPKSQAATEMQTNAVNLSLQLLKLLATTTGSTGKTLRRGISENVFTVSNIREILIHGEPYPKLEKLGIEFLTSLAMDEEAREMIGGTGGVIKELLRIFISTDERDSPSPKAGEALAMLALDSRSNCHRILKEENAVAIAVAALGNKVSKPLRINSSWILHHLYANVDPHSSPQLHDVIPALPLGYGCGHGGGDGDIRSIHWAACQITKLHLRGRFGC